jgi:hypothetical protein
MYGVRRLISAFSLIVIGTFIGERAAGRTPELPRKITSSCTSIDTDTKPLYYPAPYIPLMFPNAYLATNLEISKLFNSNPAVALNLFQAIHNGGANI